jgi:hypothetical protein
MSEIKTLAEIKAIVEAELRKHPGCEDARVTLCEIVDDSVSFDWDISCVRAGMSREIELCMSHLNDIEPRFQKQYRLHQRDCHES